MSGEVQSLQGVLAAVHATIWAYGEIGAHVSDGYHAAVAAADEHYRELRGRLEEVIRALGDDPAPSEPAYTLPSAPTDDATALKLAAQLELSMTQQWRFACGSARSQQARDMCVEELANAALADLSWRRLLDAQAMPPALPGFG